MNVIIPLGGVGSRFQKEGYHQRPKPFIPVLGTPMIKWVLDNLSLQADDTLVIIFNPAWMNMDRYMQEMIVAKYANVQLVELPGATRGAAETVRIGLQALPAAVRSRPAMLVDGDTFYTADIVGRFRAIAGVSNGVFCFEDTQPKPMYSYVKQNQTGSITEVKEKVKISDWANTGCYCFMNGEQLLQACEALIEQGEMQLSQDLKGEFYTSGVIAAMLAAGSPFQALPLQRNDFHVLGTPSQVQDFCRDYPDPPKLRFVFDLDNTLVTGPSVAGDYSSCGPIPRNIATCQRLKKQGHHIIICTARRMRTHHGNVGAVVADIGRITMDSLRKYGIPYDELVFGKPYGHFYIDDLCTDPLLGELDKQTGCYASQHVATKLKLPNASASVDSASSSASSSASAPAKTTTSTTAPAPSSARVSQHKPSTPRQVDMRSAGLGLLAGLAAGMMLSSLACPRKRA